MFHPFEQTRSPPATGEDDGAASSANWVVTCAEDVTKTVVLTGASDFVARPKNAVVDVLVADIDRAPPEVSST